MARPPRVLIIGAGAGGLSAACDLARAGLDVTVLERAACEGGKMRQVELGEARIDAGPTVFTMRWVFEALFSDAGQALGDYVSLKPARLLARHAWTDGSRLDLFADARESAEAIGRFAGAREAAAFQGFMTECAEVHRLLRDTFMAAQKPSLLSLATRIGNLKDLLRIRPFETYWSVLEKTFRDVRLRQLFGRYATYVGSSPFQAPATLMLIAHVEQDGVWIPSGGMISVARAVRRLAEYLGAKFHFNAGVTELLLSRGRISGVQLAGGERIEAEIILYNGDTGAISSGLLGQPVSRSVPGVPEKQRSLSAVTWCTLADVKAFDLAYHTVFFSADYRDEFDAIFRHRQVPASPTVYVCAQDRTGDVRQSGTERLLILVNAPADAGKGISPSGARAAAFRTLTACGLCLQEDVDSEIVTGPREFEQLFPGSGGALYGAANHSPLASFRRSGARSSVPGLYLAGGSVHPGAGIPMATLSGRLAAQHILSDLSRKLI
ncbi:MAG: 1-hydroxycarotenoid 3,4-desaturase CrtD [Hyphomonas sp.]|jgi:1-hydroxycarotenoid 3,4-desaturase